MEYCGYFICQREFRLQLEIKLLICCSVELFGIIQVSPMSSQRSLSVAEGDRSVSVRVVTGEAYMPLLAVRLEEKATC